MTATRDELLAPPQDIEAPRAARFLEQVLLGNVIAHVLGIVTMGLILMPAIPGGLTKNDAVRIAFIAEHPWLWRVGWLPWHLSALFDLLLGVALVATRWVPRWPAVLTLAVTACAVAFEQTGEIGWVTHGVTLAQAAHQTGNLSPYLRFEQSAFYLTAVVGASIYMVMSLGWTWCFIAARTWSRLLAWLTPFTWGFLAVGSVGLLLPASIRPNDTVVGVTNGVGFFLLSAWLILVTEAVLRRSRREEEYGRMAPWRHPRGGPAGRVIDAIAGSRFLRAIGEWIPVLGYRSDIRDVIYCNYLVEAGRLQPMIPAGLELQRVGPDGRYALFTHLTYHHGNFGPSFFGPFRRLMPSPVHSNWRIYVRDPRSGLVGVFFVTNAIGSTPHALLARVLSEGMPMHALAEASVEVDAACRIAVRLDPGDGSGPDLRADLRPADAELPPMYRECWPTYADFLAYAVPQDRAFSVQSWCGRLTRQEIELGIPLDLCQPLAGTVRSDFVDRLFGPTQSVQPVCFRVSRVAFRFTHEVRDRLDPAN